MIETIILAALFLAVLLLAALFVAAYGRARQRIGFDAGRWAGRTLERVLMNVEIEHRLRLPDRPAWAPRQPVDAPPWWRREVGRAPRFKKVGRIR